MTNRDIYDIARTIAQVELTLDLSYHAQHELRQAFAIMLWQKDHNFDFGEFESIIIAVYNEMYLDQMKDQFV